MDGGDDLSKRESAGMLVLNKETTYDRTFWYILRRQCADLLPQRRRRRDLGDHRTNPGAGQGARLA